MERLKIIIGKIIISIIYFLDTHRCLYPLSALFKSILSVAGLSLYHVTTHKSYASDHRSSLIDCFMTKRRGYSSNLVFDSEESDSRLMPFQLPDLYMAKHEMIRIEGNSDFILDTSRRLIINDFCYDMDSRFEFFDGILYRLKNNCALLRYNNRLIDRRLDSGIMLSGRFSANYYHQMYELQIKLLLLDRVDIPSDVPLIIDEKVMKTDSFCKIFETLNSTKREVITIGAKEIIEFNRLYSFSAVNIIPPHFGNIDNCKASDIVFDMELTMKMRERLLSIKSEKQFPRRIFLTRKNMQHRKYNESELFEALKEYGFEQLAPEEYSFEDQIAIFNGAEYIVGGTGAAFTNVLFCSEGCKIICIKSLKTNVPIFTTIAYALGADMRYCLARANKKSIHADYCVDIKKIEQML